MLVVGAGGEALLQFLFVLVASRELGPEDFGYYSYLVAIFTFVQVVVHFGLPVVVVRELASKAGATAGEVEHSALVVLRSMFRIRGWLAVISFALTIIIAFVDEPTPVRQWSIILMFLMLLFIPLDLQPLFDARKMSRWDVPGKITGRVVALLVLLMLWLWDSHLSLVEAALCSSVNLGITTGVGWWIARRKGLLPREAQRSKIQVQDSDPDIHKGLSLQNSIRNETRRLVKLAAPIMWANFANTLYVFSQIVLVKWFSTELETGYFALASRLVLSLVLLKGILYRLLLPLLSEMSTDLDRFSGRLERLIPLLALVFAPLAALGIPLCEILIVPLFGPEYLPAERVAQISLSHFFVSGFGSIFGTALFAMGYQKNYTWSITAACAVSLIFGALLIPTMGAEGAAWAMVAAELTALIITVPPALRLFKLEVGSRLSRILLASVGGLAGYYGLVYGLGLHPGAGIGALCVLCGAGLWVGGEVSPERITGIIKLIRRRAESDSAEQIP